MMNQRQVSSVKRLEKVRIHLYFLDARSYLLDARPRGFTLLETLVAITLLTVSIVAPMTLTAQSLASAYYARDQITAFFLGQEALEAVRNIRDNNILQNSQGASVNLMNGIPSGQAFTIDTRNNATSISALNPTPSCPANACPQIETDGTFYGYGLGAAGWTKTQFTRSVSVCYVQPAGACNTTVSDEVSVTVTITWRTGSFQQRTVTISENLYRWVQDGSASSG